MSDFKELRRRFGLEWSFMSTRNGKTTTSDRASHKRSYVSSSIRKSPSLVCGFGWFVLFRGVEWKKYTNSDPILITAVCGVHSNTCDPSYVDQFVLVRTHYGSYKKYADQCLKEVMFQMDIEPFVSIRAIKSYYPK